MLELAAGGRDCGFLVRVHVSGAAEARVQLHAQLAGALCHQHLRSRRGHVTCHMSHVMSSQCHFAHFTGISKSS